MTLRTQLLAILVLACAAMPAMATTFSTTELFTNSLVEGNIDGWTATGLTRYEATDPVNFPPNNFIGFAPAHYTSTGVLLAEDGTAISPAWTVTSDNAMIAWYMGGTGTAAQRVELRLASDDSVLSTYGMPAPGNAWSIFLTTADLSAQVGQDVYMAVIDETAEGGLASWLAVDQVRVYAPTPDLDDPFLNCDFDLGTELGANAGTVTNWTIEGDPSHSVIINGITALGYWSLQSTDPAVGTATSTSFTVPSIASGMQMQLAGWVDPKERVEIVRASDDLVLATILKPGVNDVVYTALDAPVDMTPYYNQEIYLRIVDENTDNPDWPNAGWLGVDDIRYVLKDTATADTDGDGLLDIEEDVDSDGVVDPGETSSIDADTDGDGLNDSEDDDPLVPFVAADPVPVTGALGLAVLGLGLAVAALKGGRK